MSILDALCLNDGEIGSSSSDPQRRLGSGCCSGHCGGNGGFVRVFTHRTKLIACLVLLVRHSIAGRGGLASVFGQSLRRCR